MRLGVHLRLAGACLLLAVTLSACASPATTAVVRLPMPGTKVRQMDRFHALLAHSHDLGPVTASTRVSFLASLRHPGMSRAAAQLAAMYDPHSTRFGHYDSLRQWMRSTGLSPSMVDQVRAVLRRSGIAVDWQPGDGWMLVGGPAGAVERVFSVRIHEYRAVSGRRYYASARDPVIPHALASIVVGTGHVSNYPDRGFRIVPVGGLRPADLFSAYNITPLRSRHLDGSGETIAFIEIDGFHQSDFNAFTQHFGLSAMHPIVRAGPRLSNVDGEAELDMEVAHEIAPGAKLLVYNCSRRCSSSDMVNLESLAVRQNPRSIINISLGGCESAEGQGLVSAESSVFTEADLLGESVFAASGDNGAFTCLDQNWGAPPGPGAIGVSSPASSPGLTSVGGTRLSLHANATWYREEVWENPPATAGSGGGVSAYFPRPSWQHGQGVDNLYDRSGRREVPDVAADADPAGSVQIIVNGHLTAAGGTSQAAPIWAGITALVDQYLRGRKEAPAGFLNPTLYALASGKPAYAPFHDVTAGSNLVYPATTGYDMASGLGTPDAWNLARDLAAREAGK